MQTNYTKILHVTHNMAIGGAEQVIKHLINEFNQLNVVSSVLCIDGRIGTMGIELQENGTEVLSINRRPGFDVKTILALRKYIKTNGVQIVHCHQYTPFTYTAAACLFLGVKVVFTEHGRFHPDRFTWKRRIANQVLYRTANHIVAISSATKEALAHYEWIPKRAVSVIYNGIDEPKIKANAPSIRMSLGIDENTVVLGTIARLDSIKNQFMMIGALAKISAQHPSTVLILAGDGPEKEALQAHALELGVSDRLIFPGFVTEIASYLESIDIFLLTSFSEGTSMTLLEAMACSKAIIATAVGGNVELIEHKKSGLLVESDNVVQLSEHIQLLLNDEQLRTKIGAQARLKYFEKFTRKDMVKAYSELYSI